MSKLLSFAVIFSLLVCLVIALKPKDEQISFTDGVKEYVSKISSVSDFVSGAYEKAEAFGEKVTSIFSSNSSDDRVKEVYQSIKGVPGATYFLNFDGGILSDDMLVRKDYYQLDDQGQIVLGADGNPIWTERYTFWVKRSFGRYEVRYCPTDPNTYEEASWWDSKTLEFFKIAENPFPDPYGITWEAHEQFPCDDPNHRVTRF